MSTLLSLLGLCHLFSGVTLACSNWYSLWSGSSEHCNLASAAAAVAAAIGSQ